MNFDLENDLPETPASLGAFAALKAKAERQHCTHIFDDPIHIRRTLIVKRSEVGANTPYGHTCSNIVEQLDSLPGYETPPWVSHPTQTLPHLINYQIQRLERLPAPAKMLEEA